MTTEGNGTTSTNDKEEEEEVVLSKETFIFILLFDGDIVSPQVATLWWRTQVNTAGWSLPWSAPSFSGMYMVIASLFTTL